MSDKYVARAELAVSGKVPAMPLAEWEALIRSIAEALRQEAADEREACAKIAELAEYSLKVRHNLSFTARGPAAEIRARGAK